MSKKGVEIGIRTMVVSAIALLALLYGSNVLFSSQSIASTFLETGEHTTVDCDGDGELYPIDECYCDPNIKKPEQEQSCGSNSEKSKELCPRSCKK